MPNQPIDPKLENTHFWYPERPVSPPHVMESVGDNLPAATFTAVHSKSVSAHVANFIMGIQIE